MKILYFEDGIKDPTLEAAQNAIMVDRTLFQDFDSVMHMYVTSKRSQKSESQAAVVAVEVAAGPAAVVSVGVTPMLDARGLFLRPTLTRSLLSRTSITLKKCKPSLLRPRRPSTGSSGTQGRNAAPVLPVAGSPESV